MAACAKSAFWPRRASSPLPRCREGLWKTTFGPGGWPGLFMNCRGSSSILRNVQTNIIIFDFKHQWLTISELLQKMKDMGILALSLTGGIRMVTHKDVDDEDVDRAIAAFRTILAQ